MAGKTTRKNKGPIGRKQHRTLRNKRQMRGGSWMGSRLSKSGENPKLDKILTNIDSNERKRHKELMCVYEKLCDMHDFMDTEKKTVRRLSKFACFGDGSRPGHWQY